MSPVSSTPVYMQPHLSYSAPSTFTHPNASSFTIMSESNFSPSNADAAGMCQIRADLIFGGKFGEEQEVTALEYHVFLSLCSTQKD
jgi:hypothetical protein